MSKAVIIFGRCNPPTVGHEMLLKQMLLIAAKKKATPILFLSGSQDNKKNPLSFDEKSQLIKAAIRGLTIAPKDVRTPYDALTHLIGKGHDDITILVGADRVADFRGLAAKWKKTEGHDIPIAVQVVADPTVARDEVSATAARTLAQLGKLDKFTRILISGQTPSKVEATMKKIQTRMGTIAEWIEREAEDLFDFALTEDDLGSSYVLVLNEEDDEKDPKDKKKDEKPKKDKKDKGDDEKDSEDDSEEDPEDDKSKDKKADKKDGKKAPPFGKKDDSKSDDEESDDEEPKERTKTTTDDENVHLNDGPVESDVKGNDPKLVLNPPEKLKKVLSDKMAERQKAKSAK